MKTIDTVMGWIPYLNLHPLHVEIFRHFEKTNLKEIAGHPTEINRLLAERKVAFAPSSSAALLLHANLEIALPLGVASSGAVQSVYLGLKGEKTAIVEFVRVRTAVLADIISESLQEHGNCLRTAAKSIWSGVDKFHTDSQDRFCPALKLSAASATGGLLAKFFYRAIFGSGAYEAATRLIHNHETSEQTLELVIGDEALIRSNEFVKIFDLGTFWKAITGMPFVYAVWQKHTSTNIDRELATEISKLAEITEAKMRSEAAHYFPKHIPLCSDGRQIDLQSYWQCLYYRLGNIELHSLLLFLCLSRSILRLENENDLNLRMIRWQNLLATYE